MGEIPPHADVVAKRRDVLTALSTPTTKPQLVERVDYSRSTVDRAIDDLLDHGFVERRGSEYVATYAGREAVAAYEGFLDRLDAVEAAQPVLGALPPSVDIEPAALHGAEVIESTKAAPVAPLEAATTLGTGATELYAAGLSVLPHYIEEVGELVEDDDETELVLTESAFDVFSSTYEAVCRAFLDADNVTVYIIEESLPYALWIAEKREETVSGIIVHTDDGISGVINNDTAAMNEWVREEYERRRRDADPLD